MFLNYKSQGSGNPVVLLHGLFGSLNNLGVISSQLANQHHTLQIDLPNHGLSPHFDQMDYDFQAKEIIKIINKEDLNNVILIGHSMGGKVAMKIALLAPDLIKKLVVLDIAPVTYHSHRHDNIFAGLNLVAKQKTTNRKQADELLSQFILEDQVRQFLLSSLYKDPENIMQWRFNLSQLMASYSNIMGWDNIRNFSFSGDTLFLKGADSDYILAEHQQQIVEQFPKARAHIINNAGHWLHSQQPEAVIRAILRFLKS